MASSLSEPFTAKDVKELHCIASMKHVPSILKRGIWSHNKSHLVRVEDLSDKEVQKNRAGKDVPRAVAGRRALKVHDHANLYFNAHNAMVHHIIFKQNKDRDDFCILRINKAILDYRHTMVANQNAATDAVQFQPAKKFSLSPKRREAILSSSSLLRKKKSSEKKPSESEQDEQDEQDLYRQMRQAEVLVPYHIPKNYIQGAYVNSEEAKRKLLAISTKIEVFVYPKLFYQMQANGFPNGFSDHLRDAPPLKPLRIEHFSPPSSPPSSPKPSEDEKKESVETRKRKRPADSPGDAQT